MSRPGRALVVTSSGSSGAIVTPVLAALEASGLSVHALDVGRAGSREEGTVGRFVRAIAGEFAERKLERELAENAVDVVIAFEPATVASLTALRDASGRPPAIIAVAGGLALGPGWAGTDADRYLVVDDAVAVALADLGLDGARVMTVGVIAPFEFVAASKVARRSLRERFGLAAGRPTVLLHVDGLGYERTQQIALQLSLMQTEANYLFDAGTDSEAATALRRQVPTLGLKAKLFGASKDVPSYWRASDVIVAAPTEAAISRALVLGCQFVALLDDPHQGEAVSIALSDRKVGAAATSPLLLSSALDTVIGKSSAPFAGTDGAGNVADVAFLVAGDRDGVVAESREADFRGTRERVAQASAFAEASARTRTAPGELEDLSGDGSGFEGVTESVDLSELRSLRRDIEARIAKVQRIVSEAQKSAARSELNAKQADKSGDVKAAAAARKAIGAERARMHGALAEMATLSGELEALSRAEAEAKVAPSMPRSPQRGAPNRPTGGGTSTRAPRQNVDELLSKLKRDSAGGVAGSTAKPSSKREKTQAKRSSVDDELAALKRKMQNQKRRK